MESTSHKIVPVLRFKDDHGEEYPAWLEMNLGQVGKIIGGGTPDTSNQSLWKGSIYWYTPVEVNEKYSSRSIRTISKAGLKRSSAKVLPAGAVLLTTRATIGKVTITTNECTTNQGYQSFVVNTSKFSNEFLYYWLTNNTNELVRRANGSTYLEVSGKEIKKISFSAPELNEQQKVADFLSSIDMRIEQLEKKIVFFELYKKGLMQKLFSQKIRFKDNDGKGFPEWEVKPFSEVFKTQSTRKHQIKSSEVFEKGRYKVVDQGKSLVAGYSDAREKILSISEGVIVYGDHTTVVKFVDFDFVVGADGTKILLPTTGRNIKFLYFCLDYFNISPEGYKRHFGIVKQILLPIPSIKEQQKIAEFLSSIDKKIELLNEMIDKSREFKKGLLQQMFV